MRILSPIVCAQALVMASRQSNFGLRRAIRAQFVRYQQKFSGEQRSELQNPSPHRFVGDIQTALRKQIFDVAIAEREAHIKPNGGPDDRGGKLVAGKRDRHAPS
jgi:hypothetical protein